MQKKILIINSNPNKESFGWALAKSYFDGASVVSDNVKIINLIELNYDPILKDGFNNGTPLENDLVIAQQLISEADHIVILYPNWWGTYPALLKGFIDRVFLPGFAFEYQKSSPLPKKLLKGKTARLIVTMDTPVWYFWFWYRSPGTNSLIRCILNYCGISHVKATYFTPVRKSTELIRNQWIEKVRNLGKKLS